MTSKQLPDAKYFYTVGRILVFICFVGDFNTHARLVRVVDQGLVVVAGEAPEERRDRQGDQHYERDVDGTERDRLQIK